MPNIYEHIDWDPGARQLRLFGWSAGGALAVLTLVISWRAGGLVTPAKVTAAASCALLVAGTVFSPVLLWVYRFWMGLTVPVGVCIQVLLLCVFFYLVLTPVGLVMRLLGRDPLSRSFEEAAPSYWIPCRHHGDPRRYFRQY